MIKFKGINHLAMATNDMDRTIRYWRDLLGLRLVAGLGEPGYRHYFFEISENDMLAFFEWPDVRPVEEKDHGYPVEGPMVFDHVSLAVETEDDLWAVKDKLEAADFPVSGVVDHGFILSVYSWDPNGIPVEFSVNVKGVDVRKNPTMKDKNPTAVALEGAAPQAGIWPEPGRETPREKRKVFPGVGSELFHGCKKD